MVLVHATYHKGLLRLKEPVDLQEGQEVEVQILTPVRQITDVIADLLLEPSAWGADNKVFDEETTQRELDAALQNKRPLSELIIEDRASLYE